MEPLSITASIIGIIGGISATSKTIKTIKGLPKAFDEVQNDLPLVLSILRSAQNGLLDGQDVTDDDKSAVVAVLQRSHHNAQELKRVFDEMGAECKKDKSAKDWVKLRTTYHKALRGVKASKVEHLMKEILEGVKKLALSQVFKLAMQQDIQALEKAIHDLSEVEPSLPDSEFGTDGQIYASQENASGAIAQQINAQGGTHSFNSGKHIIYGTGHTFHYGENKNAVNDTSNASQNVADRAIWGLLGPNPKEEKMRIEQEKGPLNPSSCEWIFGHADFQKWCYSQDSCLFWIKGDTGKGKTMLLAGIIEMLPLLDKFNSQADVMAYFFCQRGNDRTNNARAVLGGLIRSLVEQRKALKKHLENNDLHIQNESVFFTLSSTLQDILHDIGAKVYLVVDSLNECEMGLEGLVSQINTIASKCNNVRWLVSSREGSLIHGEPGSGNSTRRFQVELNRENIAPAVDIYIDTKLSDMKWLKDEPKLRQQAVIKIREKANATFLWIYFWLYLNREELKDADSSRLFQMLDDAPSQLDHMEALTLFEQGYQEYWLFKKHRCKEYQRLGWAITKYKLAISVAHRSIPRYYTGMIKAFLSLAECRRELSHKYGFSPQDRMSEVKKAEKYINLARKFLKETPDKALLERERFDRAVLNAQKIRVKMQVLVKVEKLEPKDAAKTLESKFSSAKNELSDLKTEYEKVGDQAAVRWADCWLNKLDKVM